MSVYLPLFLTSLVLSLVFTPIIRRWALANGYVAQPKEDRWHKCPCALYGGIAIFISFIIPYLARAHIDNAFFGFLAGGLAIFAVGLIDDKVRIKPHSKLIGQIITACILVYFDIRIRWLDYPLLDEFLTIFWIVAIINAFNLLDNMDGLAAGIAAISSSVIFIHAAKNGNSAAALVSILIAGAAIGFLRYNFNPAKIFMGDTGSMFLGYSIGTAAIMDSGRYTSNLLVTLAVPVLSLSVPIFDTIFVTLSRKFNHRAISQGGSDHTSHRLVALGVSERKAVLILYLISLTFGATAVLQLAINPWVMWVLVVFMVAALFYFGLFLNEVKVYSESVKQKPNRLVKVLFNGVSFDYKRRVAEVLVDLVIICSSYIAAFLLRFEGELVEQNIELIMVSLPIIIAIKLGAFFWFGIYRGVWKYVGLMDALAIIKAVTVGSILSMLVLLFLFRFHGYSRAVFIIDWMILLIAICGLRLILRLFRELFASWARVGGRRILIMGAGDGGELALREIMHNKGLKYEPIGFLDDDQKKQGKTIHGVSVLGTRNDLVEIAREKKIDEILIAIPSATELQLKDVFEACRTNNISFKHLSSVIPL